VASLAAKVTELLGIKYPIIQGGMHYVGYAELAAAVSNAGGLGLVTALTQPSPEALRAEIRKCKELTSKPFGVNLTLLPSLAPPDYPAFAQVVLDEGIKVVETAGNKPDEFIKLFKRHGVIVIHKCTQIKHALTAQKLGADMLSVDGFDCAGHPGEKDVGNWVLVPRAREELTIPFVVSGGVANGYQLAAALALGAEGVNMGTRFMATKEAPIHANIKKALVDGDENSTTLIFRTLNNTERVYKNKTSMQVVEIESKQPGDFGAIRHLVRGDMYRKSFQETGDTTDSCWSVGPAMGLIHDVPTCKELLDRMMIECEQTIHALKARL
jgi:NAD(P)H-dependent flavin oxidoreductase YrpB (nitropropane dioxygenase family)